MKVTVVGEEKILLVQDQTHCIFQLTNRDAFIGETEGGNVQCRAVEADRMAMVRIEKPRERLILFQWLLRYALPIEATSQLKKLFQFEIPLDQLYAARKPSIFVALLDPFAANIRLNASKTCRFSHFAIEREKATPVLSRFRS